MRRLVSSSLAAAAAAMVVVPMLLGTTPDEEEFRFAILASVLHVRALAQGSWQWWNADLGLGIPQPFVPNFNWHPLVALLLTISPTAWVRVFCAVHTIIGAMGMWRLCAALRMGQAATAGCVFSFLLATPTQNYVLVDFWPSHYLVWTSAPWLLLLAWRMIGATGPDLWRYAVLLGTVSGFVLANTNPGHVIVYGTVALAVVLVHWRAWIQRWRATLVTLMLAVAISGPNHVQLASERTFFGADLVIVKARDPLPPSAAWDAFLRPLTASGSAWHADIRERGTRIVFFGGPFAMLAVWGVWRYRRAHADLVLAVLISAVLLCTSLVPITFASRFHFRDPLTLCAIPLAGLVLKALFRSSRIIGAAALVIQIGAVSVAYWPIAAQTLEPEAREAAWFGGATGETPTVTGLRALLRGSDRLAYSPQVDAEVSARARLFDGLGINALAYHGLAVVNGSFKGASADVIWPDDRLFYGRIRLPATLIESDIGLDVLGIRYVLANPGEPVAEGLIQRGAVAKRDQTLLVIYENTDAWPRAFMLRGDAGVLTDLPRQAGCSNDRLLCRDFAWLGERRLPVAARIERQNGDMTLTMAPDSESRVLVVSEMFRPAWTATAGDTPVTTWSVGPGLLAVTVPPNTETVRLRYEPTLLQVVTVVAWIAVGTATAVVICLRGCRRARQRTP